ncbi:MAG: lipoate--protein ligase [Oscillospiraceae bacterium]|nr:lipoate--protein ligase [Oscillospiraceae bacterium]
MNYWYVSPSVDGWQNLAMDEWFLDTMQPEDVLLYFYVNRSAVIIGKNQNPWKECDLAAMERDDVQLVRRISGGGAVYHDEGNLNFSFITGKDTYDVTRQLEVILRAVRSFGIDCEFSGRNDLLADGKKFSGNAFCARGDLRQHHGTLLLQSDLGRLQNYLHPDPKKLRAKGVDSVRARVDNLNISKDAMLLAIRRSFEEAYGEVTDLTVTVQQLGQVVPYFEKQSSWQWRLGKTPAFDLELSERFPWGGVQLLLTLRDGTVERAEVFSDAMDADLPQRIRARLTGCRCSSRALHDALQGTDMQQNDVADFLLKQGL